MRGTRTAAGGCSACVPGHQVTILPKAPARLLGAGRWLDMQLDTVKMPRTGLHTCKVWTSGGGARAATAAVASPSSSPSGCSCSWGQ